MFSATWIRVDARVLTKGTMHVTLQRAEGLKGVEKGGTKVCGSAIYHHSSAINYHQGRREGRDEGVWLGDSLSYLGDSLPIDPRSRIRSSS